MESLADIINQLFIFWKRSILDVSQDSENVSEDHINSGNPKPVWNFHVKK